MHAEFKHIGTPLDRLIEEAGEVLQRVGKVLRFGWDNTNPLKQDSETNEDALRREIKDLETAIADLRKDRGWAILGELPFDSELMVEFEHPVIGHVEVRYYEKGVATIVPGGWTYAMRDAGDDEASFGYMQNFPSLD